MTDSREAVTSRLEVRGDVRALIQQAIDEWSVDMTQGRAGNPTLAHYIEMVLRQRGAAEYKPTTKAVVTINRAPYDVLAGKRSGADLRAIPNPPVPDDMDLWIQVPGAEDLHVDVDGEYEVFNGLRLWMTPKFINGGC